MRRHVLHFSKKTKNFVFILLAFIFLFLGILGIFLPLLPTTPFLLLTAFFFNQGSPRFHTWLLNHAILGPPIQDWQQNQVIRLRTKILATSLMALSSLYVLSRTNIPLFGKIGYSVVLVTVLIFIWSRRSRP